MQFLESVIDTKKSIALLFYKKKIELERAHFKYLLKDISPRS